MTLTAEEIRSTLNNLSSKQHVISEQAIHAKQVVEEERQREQLLTQEQQLKQIELLGEFNLSIKLLTRIFKETKFDHIMGLAVNPARMLLLNFFIGLFRGFGFTLGFLFFASLFIYFFKDSLVALF